MAANQIDAFMNAISAQESGGNYQARNSRTGAYGRFQIMPGNWAPWSRETFGRVVPRTAANQDKVARHKMLQYYRTYGSWDLVAAAWFGGPGAANSLRSGNRSVLNRSDGNMNIGAYIAKMRRGMSAASKNMRTGVWDLDAGRAVQSGATVPSRPTGYTGTDWTNYDNLFGGLGSVPMSPSEGMGVDDSEEFNDDNIENALLTAFEEMARAQTDDGVLAETEDEVSPIFDDADLDESALDLFDPDNQIETDAPQTNRLQAANEDYDPDDAELFQMPLEPLDTPFDPNSSSVKMAFDEMGQNRALELPGDLGIPAQALADVIPPREVKNIKELGGGAANKVVEIAKRYLGIPYLWGGTNPKVGLDCSGLVQLVYRQLGINLPRVSRDQARAGKRVASLAQARVGDLVAFSSARVGGAIGHIGIYIGNGMMIEAPRTGLNVRVASLKGRKPTVIRRVM